MVTTTQLEYLDLDGDGVPDAVRTIDTRAAWSNRAGDFEVLQTVGRARPGASTDDGVPATCGGFASATAARPSVGWPEVVREWPGRPGRRRCTSSPPTSIGARPRATGFEVVPSAFSCLPRRPPAPEAVHVVATDLVGPAPARQESQAA